MGRTGFLAALAASVTLVAFACARQALPGARAAEASERPATPTASPSGGHYCNMGFFTPETLARHKALTVKLAAAITNVDELPNGYAFTFSGQLREAGEWLDGVRGCCPTVEYSARFATESGPSVLSISGGGDAKEFIREEFAHIFPRKG